MIRAALAYALYRGLLFPLAFVSLHLFFPVLPRKLRQMVQDRRETPWPSLVSAPVWIHAASGEIEYAKPVIRELKARYPELPVLVTYFSPSAKRLIQGFPGIDLALALPWDRPSEVRRFLDFYKPRAGLFARTDVWPGWATEAKARGIPLLLFASTLSEDSSRTGWGRASLTRWAFSRLSAVFCVSEEDRRNVERIGAPVPAEVAGDTRYDQAFARLESGSTLPRELAPAPDDFVFVCGSTWPEDEEVLVEALSLTKGEGIRAVLVPHETGDSRLRGIERRLRDRGFEPIRFSEAKEWRPDSVLIVDQVGKLADLYNWGDVAFVGGSFREKVHSVMEPLAAGLPVLVGPRHLNNREALQFQGTRLDCGETAVRQVGNASEMADRLRFWRGIGGVHGELSARVRARTGASARVVDWIESRLGLPKAAPEQKFDTPRT